MNKFRLIFFSTFILILSTVIYLFLFEIEYFPIIELDNSYNAKCLDGTNYRFNFIPGKNEGKNKFFLYIEGGGWCGQSPLGENFIESCLERSKTPYGSKIGHSDSFVISRFHRLLSNKKKYNPNFYNWNKIFLRYCDGSSFLSDKIYEINNTKLYMFGRNNMLGALSYLKKYYNFTYADSVIISGYSAGGYTTLIYANYIDSLTVKKNNTGIICDSGFFSNERIMKIFKQIYNYAINKNEINNFFNLFCNKDYIKNEPWKCLYSDYFISNINVPILSIQNVYDSWITRVLNGNNCFLNKNYIKNCTKKQLEKIFKQENLLIENIHKYPRYDHITLFYYRKIGHVITYFNWIWDDKNFAIDGLTLNDIITLWYNTISKGKKMEKREFIETNNTHIESKDVFYYISMIGF